MRFTAALLVVIALAPCGFAQLPPPPSPSREVFAGDTYVESFKVSCVAGLSAAAAVAAVTVTVDPPAFTATVSPSRVTPGSTVTITAAVPVTTPSQNYTLTLTGVRISGDCQSGSNSIRLFVKRPLRLDVQGSASVTVGAGATAGYEILIRGRSRFGGPVTFRTSGLPAGFESVFTPPTTTGTSSTLSVRTPANATQCFEPNGCTFDIRAMADVQVEPTSARVTLRREVRLRAQQPSISIDPGQTASFTLDVLRSGYSGPVSFEAAAIEQPDGGSFALQFIPGTVTSEPTVRFDVRVDPTRAGIYRFQVRPKNTGVNEVPATVTVDANRSAIVVTPATQTINIRESTLYDIRIVESGGEKITLTEAVATPGGGVIVELVTINGQRKVKVTADANAPLRTYQLTVNGILVPAEGGARSIASAPVDVVVTDTGQRVLLFNPDTGVFSFSPGDTVDGQVNYGVTGNYRGVVSLRVTPTPPQGGVDLVFPKGSSFDTRTAPQGKVEFQLRAAPNAPLREEPARFVIEAEPDPPVPADSVNVDYRVISPNDPMVMLFISKPMQGARFSGESFIDFEVRTLRPSGCPEPPQYTATVTPAGIIDTPAFINGDFAQSTVRASNPAEPKQALIRIDVTSPPCLSDSDSIVINIDPRPVPQPLATATLSPAGQTIQRGQSATYALTVSRGGATGPVAVAIAGLPASVTATVTPNPLPGDVAQIVLATNSVTPTGTFPFTVNATLAGAPLASVTGTLTVMSPPPPGLPAITSFSPANGVAGTPVQIFGTNLTNVQNVLFSNGVGAPFAQISANQVNTTVPGFAMTGPITVITAGGVAVSSPPFIVGTQSQAPQITSFSPASGAAGTSVRLQGVNLGNPFDVSLGTAAFGFTPIPFTPFDATRIDVVIPPATPSGFFRVATPGGTATSTTAFNVTTPNLPEIGGFNPISGPPGTRVEIIGANLGGATQVTFGGVPASFEPPQPNRIFATVPPNAATGQIRVTTPNGTAISFASFAVTSGGPVITDIQPRMGSEGFSVTIAGANLSNASEVTFNGVRAVIGIVTANFVQAFVPPGATTGFVRITTPAGSATSPVEFMVQ